MIWTQEQLDALHAGYHAGKSYGIIAHEMGMTRNAVIGKARRLGFVRDEKRCGRPRQPITRLPSTPKKSVPAIAAPVKATGVPLKDPHIYPIQMNPAPILDLKPGQCRFHLDSPDTPATAETLFCGARTEPGASYCQHHAERVYIPREKPKKRERQAKPYHGLAVFGAW